MYNATFTWDLPTVRGSGNPLDPADILHTSVSLSADGGANFTLLGNIPPSAVQEVTVESIENGNWIVRFEVTDTNNRTGPLGCSSVLRRG